MEMGLPVVDPVVINIEEDFTESVQGKDCYLRVLNSQGINFGSRYLEKGYQTIPTEAFLNNFQLPYAMDIFWFDMLLQNPDRTYTKPNMLTNGEELVILDHELAFSFLMMIFPDNEPWVVTREKWTEFSTLILPGKLKDVVFNESEISEKINRLDDAFWRSARRLIPAEWMNKDYLIRIQNHVSLVQNNIGSFVQHLQTLVL